jgi:hypothetical protein
MPAFPEEEISDQDLDALVKYLVARREQRASVATK